MSAGIGTIQLTQSIGSGLSKAEQSLWPISVQALGINMPSEIFVYKVVPAQDTLPGDRYQCVASATDLEEMPTASHRVERKAHNGILSCPFYRTSTVTFNCHSAVEAAAFWQDVQDQVQRLVDNYNQWQSMELNETITISPS